MCSNYYQNNTINRNAGSCVFFTGTRPAPGAWRRRLTQKQVDFVNASCNAAEEAAATEAAATEAAAEAASKAAIETAADASAEAIAVSAAEAAVLVYRAATVAAALLSSKAVSEAQVVSSMTQSATLAAVAQISSVHINATKELTDHYLATKAALDGTLDGTSPPAASPGSITLRNWMMEDLLAYSKDVKSYQESKFAISGENSVSISSVVRYALVNMWKSLSVFSMTAQTNRWLKDVQVKVLPGGVSSSPPQSVFDLRPNPTLPVSQNNELWYQPNCILPPCIWEYNPKDDAVGPDNLPPLFLKQVNPSVLDKEENRSRLREPLQCVPSYLLDVLHTSEKAAHSQASTDLAQKLSVVPILQFTESEYYHYWAPLGFSASTLFSNPTELSPLLAELKQYLNLYPRVVVRDQSFYNVEYLYNSDGDFESEPRRTQLSNRGVVSILGDFRFCANVFDQPKASLIPRKEFTMDPLKGLKIPWSLYAQYGEVQASYPSSTTPRLFPTSTDKLALSSASGFALGAGLGNIQKQLSIQTFGSSMISGQQLLGQVLPNLLSKFQQTMSLKTGAPSFGSAAGTLFSATFTAASSKMASSTDYAVRNWLISSQPSAFTKPDPQKLTLNGSTASMVPGALSDHNSSSWLGDRWNPSGNSVNIGVDFLEATSEFARSSVFQDYIVTGAIAYYVVDETQDKLTIPGSTISWHPIVKIGGDVSSVNLSADHLNVRGHPRVFGNAGFIDYVASHHYDLKGRKGLFDLCQILCWQHKLLGKVPDLPLYMTHIIRNPYTLTTGRRTMSDYLDHITTSANMDKPWGIWLDTTSPRLNVAPFRLRHRLPDLDYIRENQALSGKCALLPIMAIDFNSASWFGAARHYLPSYALYHAENPTLDIITGYDVYPDLKAFYEAASPSAALVSKAMRALWPCMVNISNPRLCSQNIRGIARIMGDWTRTTHDMKIRASTTLMYQQSRQLMSDTTTAVFGPHNEPLAEAFLFASSQGLVSEINTWIVVEKDVEDSAARLDLAFQGLAGKRKGKTIPIDKRILSEPSKTIFKAAFIYLNRYITQGLEEAEARVATGGLQMQVKAYVKSGGSDLTSVKAFVIHARASDFLSRPRMGYGPERQSGLKTLAEISTKAKANGMKFLPSKLMLEFWVPSVGRTTKFLVDPSFLPPSTIENQTTGLITGSSLPPRAETTAPLQAIYASLRSLTPNDSVGDTYIVLQADVFSSGAQNLTLYANLIEAKMAVLQLILYSSDTWAWRTPGSDDKPNLILLNIDSIEILENSHIKVNLRDSLGSGLIHAISTLSPVTVVPGQWRDHMVSATGNMFAFICIPDTSYFKDSTNSGSAGVPWWSPEATQPAYALSWNLQLTSPNTRIRKIEFSSTTTQTLTLTDSSQLGEVSEGDSCLVYMKAFGVFSLIQKSVTVTSLTTGSPIIEITVEGLLPIDIQAIREGWGSGIFAVLMRGDAFSLDNPFLYAEVSGGKVAQCHLQIAATVDASLDSINIYSSEAFHWLPLNPDPSNPFLIFLRFDSKHYLEAFECEAVALTDSGNGLTLKSNAWTTVDQLSALVLAINSYTTWNSLAAKYDTELPSLCILTKAYDPYSPQGLTGDSGSSEGLNRSYWRNWQDGMTSAPPNEAVPFVASLPPPRYGLTPDCLNTVTLANESGSSVENQPRMTQFLNTFMSGSTKNRLQYVTLMTRINEVPVTYQPMSIDQCFGDTGHTDNPFQFTNSVINPGLPAAVVKVSLYRGSYNIVPPGSAANVDVPMIHLKGSNHGFSPAAYKITPANPEPGEDTEWFDKDIIKAGTVLGVISILIGWCFNQTMTTCMQNCKSAVGIFGRGPAPPVGPVAPLGRPPIKPRPKTTMNARQSFQRGGCRLEPLLGTLESGNGIVNATDSFTSLTLTPYDRVIEVIGQPGATCEYYANTLQLHSDDFARIAASFVPGIPCEEEDLTEEVEEEAFGGEGLPELAGESEMASDTVFQGAAESYNSASQLLSKDVSALDEPEVLAEEASEFTDAISDASEILDSLENLAEEFQKASELLQDAGDIVIDGLTEFAEVLSICLL
jgi:hypothetical protein